MLLPGSSVVERYARAKTAAEGAHTNLVRSFRSFRNLIYWVRLPSFTAIAHRIIISYLRSALTAFHAVCPAQTSRPTTADGVTRLRAMRIREVYKTESDDTSTAAARPLILSLDHAHSPRPRPPAVLLLL